MPERLEIQVSSQYESNGEKKWRNRTVGMAFEQRDGGWSLLIDPGISIHGGEGIRVSLRKPYDKNKPRGSSQPSGDPGPTDDDIPF